VAPRIGAGGKMMVEGDTAFLYQEPPIPSAKVIRGLCLCLTWRPCGDCTETKHTPQAFMMLYINKPA
jgi:hypothetical protein